MPHTTDGGSVSARMAFGEFAGLLDGDGRFFLCERGVLVNLDHAVDFDGTMFQLSDGGQLAVSRNLAGEARRAFWERLFQRNVKEFLRPVLELTILLPGLVLSCLPMSGYLRISGRRLAAVGIPALLVVCLLAGGLCHWMGRSTLVVAPPILAVTGVLYCRLLKLSLWKSVNVFLGMCGVFSCLLGLGSVADALLRGGEAGPWLCLWAGVAYNAMGWALTGLAWYPARRAVPALLEGEGIAETWYVFWILPLVVIGANLFMIPRNPDILYQGRVMAGYILLSLVLLGLLGLLYLLFYRTARGSISSSAANTFLTTTSVRICALWKTRAISILCHIGASHTTLKGTSESNAPDGAIKSRLCLLFNGF